MAIVTGTAIAAGPPFQVARIAGAAALTRLQGWLRQLRGYRSSKPEAGGRPRAMPAMP